MSTPNASSYAAGLFDGEGTVTLTKSGRGYRYPVASVSSTTPALLAFLHERFGGSISVQKSYKETNKQAWSWKVERNAALAFFGTICPFMLEPKKRARMSHILSHYKEVTKRNGRYSTEEMAKKIEFETAFFAISDGGPGGIETASKNF